MTDILVISQADKQTHLQAKKVGLTLIEAEQTPAGQALPAYDKALFVAAGVQIPWHLVEYGLHVIERWDAAAPLWRYGILAKDVGSEGERKATEQIVRDLRVPLYACELLFVKGSEAGRQLVAVWEEERARSFGVPQDKPCQGMPCQGKQLVRVQIAPGVYVRCYPGHEQEIVDRLGRGKRRK